MDRVSESLLSEFSTERGLSLLGEDARFEHFACFITVGRHYNETFDTEDILVGEATGIDGIAIIVNGVLISDVESLEELDGAGEFDVTFIFIQADRGSNFDASKMGDFGFAVVDFFKEQPQLPRNEQIASAASIMSAIYQRSTKFKRGNPACRLYFATTGTWVGDQVLEVRRKTVVDDLSATNLFRDVSFVPLGAEGVQKLYRQTKNAIEREFIFENRVTIPEVPGVVEAYLGFLPVPELMKIVTDDNGEMIPGLFYSNPRDWQDYNDVNAEIKDTLKSADKSRFVLMNNGITIIARDVRPTGNKFVIEDYQIVNGCQTSHVLFEQADKADKNVAVPVRLIGTQDEAVINAIIRATNRQTPVTEDQFFALQEFPKQLEQFFQTNRIQLTTDGHKMYLSAVPDAFGSDIDYAQLIKVYGNDPVEGQKRYSPAQCLGTERIERIGSPDQAHISTSYVERQNLNMRMNMRRFTRLTNGFSKKIDNLIHTVALFHMHYNFARVHQTLRVTPAMEVGLSSHVWSIQEIISLSLPAYRAAA
jgi:hypothetical protein